MIRTVFDLVWEELDSAEALSTEDRALFDTMIGETYRHENGVPRTAAEAKIIGTKVVNGTAWVWFSLVWDGIVHDGYLWSTDCSAYQVQEFRRDGFTISIGDSLKNRYGGEVGRIEKIRCFHKNEREVAEFTLDTYDARTLNWPIVQLYLNDEL